MKLLIKFMTSLIVFAIFVSIIGCFKRGDDNDLIGMDKNSLNKLLEKTPNNSLKVDILNEIAYRESRNGEQEALNKVCLAKKLAEEINYKEGYVDAFCILGQIYFLNGDFDSSKRIFDVTLEYATQIEYSTGKAMAYNGIARYHQIKGEYATALKLFLTSEEICNNSSHKKDKKALAEANYGFGALYYYDPEDFKEASKYFQRSLELGIEIKDNYIITSGYYTIGVQLQALGDNENARINLEKCLDLSKKIGLIYNQANAYEGLGDMYLDVKDYDNALENYEKSYTLFLKTGNLFQISEIEKRLGKFYIRKKEYQKAVNYLEKSFDRACKSDIPKTIVGICEEIVIAKEGLDDYISASDYYKILLENKESLRKNEMLKQKLILDFEQASKKRTYLLIALCSAIIIIITILYLILKLRKQKVKIEDQAKKLESALIIEKETSIHKDLVMNKVYHQYKTPLANIDSCVQVLKEYSAKLSEKDIENQYDKILSNLGRMTRLMDQLSLFGRNFNPENYVDLEKICREVVEEIQASEGDKHIIKFDSSRYCGEIKMDKDILEVMLQNLINNSIKFSPQETIINVEILCDSSYVFIKVSDKGIGIPEDYLKRPYERFNRGNNVGTIPGTGLGLSIVKRYTDMHYGEISIDSKVGIGTTVTIKIPRNANVIKG